ncbi:hypothetical protein CNY89_03930, partial [Amaricoccus sp. HAR-UPW-R2A-40]
GTLTAPGDFGAAGGRCRLRIAASDVSLLRETPQGSSVLNFPPARIVSAERQGAAMLTVVLALGEAGQARGSSPGSPGCPGSGWASPPGRRSWRRSRAWRWSPRRLRPATGGA